VFLIRYENLCQDTAGEMHRLFDYLGIQLDGKRVARALETMSFKNLSGGREIGDEDVSSYYRKGVPGDWCNYLAPDKQRETVERYGEELGRLGY
jgi:hypothetical protein